MNSYRTSGVGTAILSFRFKKKLNEDMIATVLSYLDKESLQELATIDWGFIKKHENIIGVRLVQLLAPIYAKQIIKNTMQKLIAPVDSLTPSEEKSTFVPVNAIRENLQHNLMEINSKNKYNDRRRLLS